MYLVQGRDLDTCLWEDVGDSRWARGSRSRNQEVYVKARRKLETGLSLNLRNLIEIYNFDNFYLENMKRRCSDVLSEGVEDVEDEVLV